MIFQRRQKRGVKAKDANLEIRESMYSIVPA